MTYNNELSHYDDFESQMDDQWILGYRKGVDQVLTYIESIHRYDTLLSELRWAIKEGIL